MGVEIKYKKEKAWDDHPVVKSSSSRTPKLYAYVRVGFYD